MAETKKPKKIISADTGAETTVKQPAAHAVKQAQPTGNAGGLRIGAVVLWIAALLFEVLGVMIALGSLTLTFMPTLYQLIAVIVLDLACVIIGAQLWKKANHIDPVSEKNKMKFWLWNNMGVIACVVAFVPFVVVLLTNKNLDGNTKKIASIVAIVALLIGGIGSYDFNPVSAEQKEAAVSALGGQSVLWTQFGKVYHTSEDCQALNRSDTLTQGNVDQAIAANKTRLCAFCAKRDDISGVVTDDAAVPVSATDEAGEVDDTAQSEPEEDTSLADAA